MKNKNIIKRLCYWILSVLPIQSNEVIDTFTVNIINEAGFGLYIINNKANVKSNSGYAATASWKLVYNIGNMEGVSPGSYGICNFLTDGWIYPIGDTVQEVCDHLNKDTNKYRIMTKSEVTYLINKRDQGFK